MIFRIRDSHDAADFFCKHPVETVTAAALCKAFGVDGKPFSLFAQKKKGHLVALLGVYGDAGQLTLTDEADASQWITFFRFVGLKSVVTDGASAKKLLASRELQKTPPSTERALLLGLGRPTLAPPTDEAALCRLPNLRAVHKLLKNYLPVADEDSFVADMQARINHHIGGTVAYQTDGALVGTASVFFESDTVSFLGGIATDSRFRGRGIASGLVSDLCRDALSRGKRPVLACVNPTAERVYRSLGFEPLGERITLTF